MNALSLHCETDAKHSLEPFESFSQIICVKNPCWCWPKPWVRVALPTVVPKATAPWGWNLLDTNIVIYVIKSRPMPALQLFNQHAGQLVRAPVEAVVRRLLPPKPRQLRARPAGPFASFNASRKHWLRWQRCWCCKKTSRRCWRARTNDICHL